MIDLQNNTWAIFGPKRSGKSTLAAYIAQSYGDLCLYYDTLHEVPSTAPYHAYKPIDRQSVAELETLIATLKTLGKKHILKARMLIIDEANRFARPKPSPLPRELADLNDWCRHPPYQMSVGYLARRPVQLNQDLTEICDYLFVFALGGKNDISYLNDLRSGLGDAARGLRKHHFLLVNPDRTWSVCSPINLRSLQSQGSHKDFEKT